MKEKVIVSWSGGKDSALALYELHKNKNYEIVALLTTKTDDVTPAPASAGVNLSPRKRGAGVQSEKTGFPLLRPCSGQVSRE